MNDPIDGSLAPPPALEAAARSGPGRARHLPGAIRPGAMRILPALAGGAFFVLSLQLLKAGAAAVVPLFDGLGVAGVANSTGFGWLLAYGALSGSPAAAFGVSLLSGGVLTPAEALGVIAGSRMGASFIVLAVGFVLLLLRRRNSDGLYVGVIALLTTFTTQGPALLGGLALLERGWLDGAGGGSAFTPVKTVDRLFGPPTDLAADVLPDSGLLLFGMLLLLVSFGLFDRALPTPEQEGDTFTRLFARLSRDRFLMLLLGAAVTSATMSVSISVTLLVPLALKGYLRREDVIPYVMGANVTTFLDTLAAAMLTGSHQAGAVVLAEMLSMALAAIIILVALYRPYSTAILYTAEQVCRRPRNMTAFLCLIVAVPLALLLV